MLKKENMKDKIKLFSKRHLFNYIHFKQNSLRIPILSNEYKNDIKNEVLRLDYEKFVTHKKRNERTRNSIFKNIYTRKPTFQNLYSKEKMIPTSVSMKKLSLKKIELNKKRLTLKKIENQNSTPIFFLTNNSSKDDFSNNKISNDSTSFSSCITERKLPPIRRRKEFMKYLDNYINEADQSFDSFHKQFKSDSEYEEDMINKCNKYFKDFDDKLNINTDKYINEKLIDHKRLNVKFNDFFERLISQNKEFDYISIMNILKSYHKKKKFEEIVNKQKMEKNHRKLFKVLEDNIKSTEKVYKLYDSVMNKKEEE